MANMQFKKNKIYSGAMLTVTALSLATPAIANAATTNTVPAADKVVAQKDKQTDNKAANKTEVNKTTDKSSDKSTDKTTAAVVNNKKESDPDNPQTLKEQTMIINKVIASSDKDTSTDNLKGVNGAKFTVYDVTDLMNTIIKEELKTSDSKPSDSQIDDAIKKAEDTSEANTVNADTTDTANVKSDDKNADTKKTDSKAATTTSKQEAKDSKEANVDKTKADSKNQAENQTSTKDQKAQSKDTTAQAKDDKASDTTDKKVESDKDTAADKKEDSTAADDALIQKVDQMRKDDTLRKEIATRAGKLDTTQMKKFAEVTTAHDNASKKDGVARVKLPIDGKYHAYYVVNTETPKEAMAKNSDPIVVITPITDKDGKYSADFTVYPKSEAIKPADKQTPGQTTSQAKMYQTGKSHGFWANVVSYVQNLFS